MILSRVNNNLKVAIILSFIFNLVIAFSGYYLRTYDSYGHMFFAQHYQANWFDTWEPKWYTGFNVASYPPLAHQVLALVGFGTGLESAYIIITFALMIILPIGVFKFAKVFVSEEAAGYASLVSIFFPGIFYAVYVWGQYTTLFSLVLTLFMIPIFYKYLKKGGILYFAELIFLFEAVVASHHFTGLIFAPLLLFTTLLTMLVKKETNLKTILKRSLLFVGVGLLLSITIIYPVLISAVAQNVNIPHPSTKNYFQNLDMFQLFFVNMYGFFLVLIPLIALSIRYRKNLIPLFALAIFLLILGLGGTTPLPQLIFGQNWLGFTYERFNFFAILVFAPLFGLTISLSKKKKIGKSSLTIFIVLCILFSSWAANESIFLPHPSTVPVETVVNFLNHDDHWMWRYLTLGFSASDFGKLSIYSNATTIDGWYYRGRDMPELEKSGFGFFSDAKFYNNGIVMLRSILENSSQYHLRFVFCNDAIYEHILNETGFNRLDFSYEQVTVWVKYDSPPLGINEIVNTNHVPSLQEYSWGIIPITWLTGFLFLTTFEYRLIIKRIFEHIQFLLRTNLGSMFKMNR